MHYYYKYEKNWTNVITRITSVFEVTVFCLPFISEITVTVT